jgi:hypothetical protein
MSYGWRGEVRKAEWRRLDNLLQKHICFERPVGSAGGCGIIDLKATPTDFSTRFRLGFSPRSGATFQFNARHVKPAEASPLPQEFGSG